MKKALIFKVFGALLLFIFTMCFTACKKQDDAPSYDENKRLEITEVKTEFNEEFLTESSVRFTRIASSLTKTYVGISFSDKDLANTFNSTLVPILYRVNIYPEELDEIFDMLDDYTSSDVKTDKPMVLSVYEICLYVLGSEKSGHLAYEVSLAALNHRINTYTNRLNSSGISFYKSWIARCTALYNDVEAMGKTKFTDALSMTTTIFATSSSIKAEVTENAFLLTDEALLFILEREGEMLRAKCLTEEEWQAFGGLVSEFMPNAQANLNQKVIYAMKNYTHSGLLDENNPSTLYSSSYFATAMRVMPKIVSLFADVTARLNEGGTFSLEGTSEEKERAFLIALSECEDGIRELDTALKTYASFNNAHLDDTLSDDPDAKELEDFISSHTAKTCEDFILLLQKIKNGGDISNASFNEFLISYVYSYSPNLAYVVFLNLK